MNQAGLDALERRVVACRRCPELRAYCAQIARSKKRQYDDWTYWGKPVPALGGAAARLALVGLAPGAHGSNRTGRMFTGDASGVWLYRALYRAGFANQAHQHDRNDGLRLDGAFITAALRCAPPGNKPTPRQLQTCFDHLRCEFERLHALRVVVGLGAIGTRAARLALEACGYRFDRPPRFAHLAEAPARRAGARDVTLLASYHPSRQNTNTGLLTEPMFDAVFARARELLSEVPAPLSRGAVAARATETGVPPNRKMGKPAAMCGSATRIHITAASTHLVTLTGSTGNVKVVARLLRGWLALIAIVVAGLAIGAVASAQPAGELPPEFGSPPSGEIPILFNDHHVYAKPDRLKQGRVLAAIVKDGTVLVPLRSLFEQTGATVSYDPSTKTVDVAKPGADVKVTVGKPWVVVNGEERPLDVPPEFYKGSIVVPLRVFSEGMGAYVQWVPDKRLVVIRYVEQQPSPPPPPTAPPTAPPTPAPVATPGPSPTPAPAPKPKLEHYVAGDFAVSPKVYNELSAGNKGKSSYEVKGAIEFPFLGPTWELSANYRHFLYPHYSNLATAGCTPGTAGCNTVVGNGAYQLGACGTGDPGCVTTIGYPNTIAQTGLGQVYVAAFTPAESDADVRFGLRVASPRFYLAVSGFFKNYNYLGYPNLSGVGVGIEKLPDLDQPFSVYGSAFYYPNVSGKYTYPTSSYLGPLSGSTATLAYSEWKYEVGGTFNFGNTGLFLDFGYLAERAVAKTNAPSNTTISSPYVGLGFHF